ncbi:phosphatidylinositol-4-phosphate-5-kinase (PI-PIPK-B) [Achlya hypogyna]|uniref:Phosphatidylinositol-4-phosphate-5-kinase (PI-PIPK-B) n=1 Tax=Achlya hypogyna TaxID=1202772 RepID=A0A1V9YBU2_ACHHY|nr:phosphatidylinositol-4-phosphate-5-kinase (PI-PIPK-B) [Achlya hypogyna]
MERIPRAWVDDGGMETVVEEVFEVQSLHPYKFPLEWRVDARRWLDRTGNIPTSRFCSFPSTFSPAAENDMPDDLKHYWCWNHPWVVDTTYTACDIDGWVYGTSISAMNKHLAKGMTKAKRRPQDFVRRRRWIRMRIKLASCQPPASSSSASAYSAEEPRYYRSLRVDSRLSHALHCRSTPINHMQNMTFDKANIVMEGWLGKCGSYSHTWKLRYFILRDDFNTLVYLKDLHSLLQLGQVYINGHTSVFAITYPPNSKLRHQFAFEILNGKTRLRLNAPSGPTRADWMAAISSMIINRRSSFMMGDGDDGAALVDGSFRKHKPKAWQPYSLKVSSTVRDMPHTKYVETCYIPLVRRIEKLFTAAKSFVMSILADLADTSARGPADIRIQKLVADGKLIPEDLSPDIERLRTNAIDVFNGFALRVESLQATESLLEINRVKEDLYQSCRAIIEGVFEFQSTTSKRLINAKRMQSSKRRSSIPVQWTRPDADEAMTLSVTSSCTSLSRVSSSASSDAEPKPPTAPRVPESAASGQHAALAAHKQHKQDVRRALRSLFDERAMHLESGVQNTIVWVHEDDLGSLIAYTLLSAMYVEQLESSCRAINVADELLSSTNCMNKATALQILNTASANHFKCHVVLRQAESDAPAATDAPDADEAQHIVCMVYFATQFHALRQICRPGNRAYVESICQSAPFATSGGKSGAFFNLAHDRRFILKGVTAAEFNMFIDFAPEYFKYLSRCFEAGQPSCLAKILGAYKLRLPSHGAKWTHVIIMENSNFGFSATQMFDLKGVMRRRYLDPNDAATQQCRVLPDGNFMDRIPVPIREDELAVFSEAVARDVEFLVGVDVIDYSLLLSFDDSSRELRASIIDYLHQYDFLKKVESSAKTMYTTPTVIPPEAYERRFLDAMHRYFVGIPEAVATRNGSEPRLRTTSDSDRQTPDERNTRAMSDYSNQSLALETPSQDR